MLIIARTTVVMNGDSNTRIIRVKKLVSRKAVC